VLLVCGCGKKICNEGALVRHGQGGCKFVLPYSPKPKKPKGAKKHRSWTKKQNDILLAEVDKNPGKRRFEELAQQLSTSADYVDPRYVAVCLLRSVEIMDIVANEVEKAHIRRKQGHNGRVPKYLEVALDRLEKMDSEDRAVLIVSFLFHSVARDADIVGAIGARQKPRSSRVCCSS